MPGEKRKSQRTELRGKAQVHYVDALGQARFEIVQVRDAGRTGCRVVLRFRCEPRTVVTFHLSPSVRGSATIRYQNQKPTGFETGLEFLGGLELPDTETS